MAIAVDIADRQYDYNDEEKAADAVAEFQSAMRLDDAAVIALWNDHADPRRASLERRIFDAVDLNGSAKRAASTIPGGITLSVAESAQPSRRFVG